MATMFVRHTVSDYRAWRKMYDDFAPVQAAMGITAKAVYQSADNPNDITVTHDFPSVGAAQDPPRSRIAPTATPIRRRDARERSEGSAADATSSSSAPEEAPHEHRPRGGTPASGGPGKAASSEDSVNPRRIQFAVAAGLGGRAA